MPGRTIICVFAKPPVAGSAKTRLASKIGATPAAAFAQAFLQDTWATVSALPWARVILATTDNRFRDFCLRSTAEIWLQGEGDLGQRIERVVKRGLAKVDTVIAVGADTPGLPPRLLEQAREELTLKDAVLGPCDDGGFYLIGLRRCPEGLFEGLPWSSPDTFAAMKARLESVGMSIGMLDRWFDVDEVEDLDRLRSEISQGHIDAPATKALLTAHTLRISVVVPVLNEEREIPPRVLATLYGNPR